MIPPLPRRRFHVLSLALADESDMPRPDGGSTLIHIRKVGMRSGPYTSQEVREALAVNKMSANDLTWHKGLVGWTPLSIIFASATVPQHAPNNAFYERLYNVVLGGVTELLGELDGSSDSLVDQRSPNALEIFLEHFPHKAAAFITRCSTLVATEVRHLARIESVKSAPTERLAMEMREAVFKQLDDALRQYRVDPGRTQEYGEKLFIDYTAALRTLPAPLVECASSKCYGAAVDRQEQEACARVLTAQCNELVDDALRRFSEAFAGCESYERRVLRFAQSERDRTARIKLGCTVAPVLIAVLVIGLVMAGSGLNEFAGAAAGAAILILLFVCGLNLLKLFGL